MNQGWMPLLAVSWTSPPLFNLVLARAGVEQRFGLPHAVNCDSNGVGLFDAWQLRFACDLEVGLCVYHQVGDARSNTEVYANQRDAEHILFHLGASGVEIDRWEPDPCPRMQPRVRLLRSDDNGNTFEVARFTSVCEADAAAHRFASRGHKQTYWVEPLGS